MNVLLIEDSRFLRTAIERALSKTGHVVTGVADGQEGLRLARTSLPDIILLDMMLPGLDGTGVLRKLKQDASTAEIPVVVLTGLSQKNEARLKQEGAAAYIAKSTLDLEKSGNVLSLAVEALLGPPSRIPVPE
jgi:CheY-like chemotaxis protein